LLRSRCRACCQARRLDAVLDALVLDAFVLDAFVLDALVLDAFVQAAPGGFCVQ